MRIKPHPEGLWILGSGEVFPDSRRARKAFAAHMAPLRTAAEGLYVGPRPSAHTASEVEAVLRQGLAGLPAWTSLEDVLSVHVWPWDGDPRLRRGLHAALGSQGAALVAARARKEAAYAALKPRRTAGIDSDNDYLDVPLLERERLEAEQAWRTLLGELLSR